MDDHDDVRPLTEAELTSIERSLAMAPLTPDACRRLIATVRSLQARQRHPSRVRGSSR
jgi:hypothetical protein